LAQRSRELADRGLFEAGAKLKRTDEIRRVRGPRPANWPPASIKADSREGVPRLPVAPPRQASPRAPRGDLDVPAPRDALITVGARDAPAGKSL
jgi:hypothetical protein